MAGLDPQTQEAMAHVQRGMRDRTQPIQLPERPARVRQSTPYSWRIVAILLVVAVALTTAAIGMAISNGVHARISRAITQDWNNRWHNGFPPVVRHAAHVGHDDFNGPTTRFTGENINGWIIVTEYPGNNPAQPRTIVGPYVYDDLLVVPISTRDITGDGHVDLVFSVNKVEVVFVNDSGQFRPMTAAERSKVMANMQEKK